MLIYREILTAFWAIFIVYWFISALFSKKNARMGSGMIFRIFAIIIFFIFLEVPVLRTFVVQNLFYFSNPIVNSIGIIVVAAGMAFAVWARVHLGKNWGMPMSLKKDPELVTSGPYAFVRNPIYTGMLTALIGSAFVDGTVWFIPFLFALVYFFYAAKKEEKIMLKAFPDQYPEYKKRTKMLIPFII